MLKRLILMMFIFLSTSIALADSNSLAQVRWQALPGTVALTFDDGPSPEFTPQVLDILRKNNIKATFFVMGWAAKKYPDLIKQMLADGHAVADHTMSHPKLTKLSDDKLHYEIVTSKELITAAAGYAPVCLRPPYGMGNKHVEEYIHANGMVMVPMGFNSFDYERPGVEKLTNWVIKNAQSGRVFLMHDGLTHREQTVAALPAIIDGIKNKGLGFSAICYPLQSH